MSKTLDRISLLLAQAEGASTPEEAAAYTEKAQQLATIAAIDLEVARQRQVDRSKRETPVSRQITVASYVSGSGYRSRVQNNAAEHVWLFSAIASQNDVKIDIAHNSTYVIAYGFPSDIDVVEALFSSLLVQMRTAADEEVKKGDYKNEEPETYWCTRDWKTKTRKPDARRFRTSFYQAFTSRISARLRAARSEALAAAKENTFSLDLGDGDVVTSTATSTEAGLVLVEKAVEVADFHKQTSRARGSYRGGSGSRGDSDLGSRSGAAAGDRASLGARTAIGGSRTAVTG